MKFVHCWLLGALLSGAVQADALQGEAGAGLSWQVREPSGSRHEVKPMPYFDLQWQGFDLDSEDGLSWAAAKGYGLSAGPFVNYIPGRTANGPLRGLRDVDDMGEGGAFIAYSLAPWWRLSAQAGQAFGAGTGQGGALGKLAGELDYPLGGGPSEKETIYGSTELTAHHGDQRYEQTFFGVAPAQSQATGLSAYHASGGLQDITLSQGAQIPLSEHWSLLGNVSWIHLEGAAQDSSLVRVHGQVNQTEVQTAIAYRFE